MNTAKKNTAVHLKSNCSDQRYTDEGMAPGCSTKRRRGGRNIKGLSGERGRHVEEMLTAGWMELCEESVLTK